MLNNTSYYETSPETLGGLIHLAVNRINEKLDDDNHVVYLAWYGQYSFKVSCSHDAPKGELTNWGGRYKRPKHFPGWHGRVWISTKHKSNKLGFEALHNTGISSGTGGHGLYDLPDWVKLADKYRQYNMELREYPHYPISYDSKIFEQDFPLLSTELLIDYMTKQREHQVKKVANTLTRSFTPTFNYKFPTIKSAYVHPDYHQ